MKIKNSESEFPNCYFCEEDSELETKEFGSYRGLRMCRDHAKKLYKALKKRFEDE